jgi:hypothetical protein
MTAQQIQRLRALIALWRTTAADPRTTAEAMACADDLEQVLNACVVEQQRRGT